LFICFSSSHSPLCSSVKQIKILKNNSQKKAEIKSRQFLETVFIFFKLTDKVKKRIPYDKEIARKNSRIFVSYS
ncbi:hypothetical protein, partial [Bacteroides rodentium]